MKITDEIVPTKQLDCSVEEQAERSIVIDDDISDDDDNDSSKQPATEVSPREQQRQSDLLLAKRLQEKDNKKKQVVLLTKKANPIRIKGIQTNNNEEVARWKGRPCGPKDSETERKDQGRQSEFCSMD